MRMRLDSLARLGDGTWLLMLKPEDTKNHTRQDLPLGARCTRLMDDYLHQGRDGFPRAAMTDHVWMGMKGPMTVEGIARSFEEFSRTCFGEVEGPQAARRWLRSEAVRNSPELAFDAGLVLGHSPEVSIQHYAEATTLHAALRHAQGLAQLRSGKTSEPVPSLRPIALRPGASLLGRGRRTGRGRAARLANLSSR